jgi:hypothetical protein
MVGVERSQATDIGVLTPTRYLGLNVYSSDLTFPYPSAGPPGPRSQIRFGMLLAIGPAAGNPRVGTGGRLGTS